ncbi:MAG: DUF6020 family protein [Roseburia sp.]
MKKHLQMFFLIVMALVFLYLFTATLSVADAANHIIYAIPAVFLYFFACLYYRTHRLFLLPQDIPLGIVSIILSFCSFSGFYATEFLNKNNDIPTDFNFLSFEPVSVVLFATFLFVIFKWLTEKGRRFSPKKTVLWTGKEKKLFSAIITAVLFCCYLFWVLCFYPGSVANDTKTQIYEFLGISPFYDKITDINPIFVTILYGMLYQTGSTIGDSNFGLFLGNLTQVLFMAFAFSQACILIGEKTNSKGLCFFSAVLYSIVPIWGAAAQCLLKDSIHVSFFTLFFVSYIRILDQEKMSNKELTWLLALMLLVAFTRKGSFYIVILCIIPLFSVFSHTRHNRRKAACVSVSLVAVYFMVESIILPYFDIVKSPFVENLSLPLQQISLVYLQHGDDLSSEEVAIIQEIMECDKIDDVFNHDLADPIKKLYLDNDGNHTKGLLWLYIRLGCRYPKTYLNALVGNNWKYFYPLSPGTGGYRHYIPENTLGWETVLTWDYCIRYFRFWSNHFPLNLFIGPGLYIWTVFISAAVAFASRNKKKIGIAAPILCFSIGLLLTPVNGEVRYAYPIIAVTPLVLIMCLVDNKSAEGKQNIKPADLPDDSSYELRTVGNGKSSLQD